MAKGYTEAIDYARSVGAETIQVFAKSPRQWKAKAIDRAAAEAFVAYRDEVGFGPVFTHTAYLINLATDDEELRAKSVAALADELVRGAALGAAGVVTHLGNDPAGDTDAAAARVGDSIRSAYGISGVDVRLLLENTAGAGRTFGSNCAELSACLDAADMDAAQLGVCIDTCHLFAFGAALDTAEGWDDLVRDIDVCMGLDRLGLIHANDCMFERGSKRDRHAWIGDGYIGRKGFSAMVCQPRLREVPVVTEMPGEVPVKDQENISRLKAMRDACAGSQ